MTKRVSGQNWLIELCDEIIFMLDNDEFNYTNSIHYNSLIAKLFRDYGNSIISYNQQEENPSRFFDVYTQEEEIALNIFRDLLKESNKLININLNNSDDITLLEKYFNKIALNYNSITTSQVVQNYTSTHFPITSIPNHSNIHNKKIIKANEKRLDDIYLIKEQQRKIDQQQNFFYQRNFDRKDKIIQNHYRTIRLLENQDLKIWKDQNNKLFYRAKAFEKEQKISKADLEDITYDFYTKVYDTTEDVQVIDAKYIITSLLPTLRKDIFNPFTNNEFILISNKLQDKNKFEYTKLLEKRLYLSRINSLHENINYYKERLLAERNSYHLRYLYKNLIYETENELKLLENSLIVEKDSFIERFIKLLFQNDEEYNFFIIWLAGFFFYLEKSNIAVVLIGDTETTDILIDFIVKPIFIKKKTYLSTITNNILDKESENEKLLEDKIFYHINNLTSKTNSRRVSKLIRSIVKPNPITQIEAWDNDKQYIYGELLITTSKESPYPFLKNVLSSCSVFRVRDIESVLNKLDMDYPDFEKSMINDLDNFTNKLVQYAQNNCSLTVLNTDEKTHLSAMKNGVLITPKIDRKINYFVEDILNVNINAFKSIQHYDENIYNELIYNFEEKMISQPMLSSYFNIIHDEELIPDNNEFIKILQGKATMYNKPPTDKSKYNGKKRYKIFKD